MSTSKSPRITNLADVEFKPFPVPAKGVLEGEGEIRIGDAKHPIRKGDFIACPPGGPETAHQIINTGVPRLEEVRRPRRPRLPLPRPGRAVDRLLGGRVAPLLRVMPVGAAGGARVAAR
jgi:hypothetical protein